MKCIFVNKKGEQQGLSFPYSSLVNQDGENSAKKGDLVRQTAYSNDSEEKKVKKVEIQDHYVIITI